MYMRVYAPHFLICTARNSSVMNKKIVFCRRAHCMINKTRNGMKKKPSMKMNALSMTML